MIQIYVAYSFVIQPLQPAREILVAELGNIGFESFIETESGLTAYIPKSDWYASLLNSVFVLNNNEFRISYEKEEIEPINWNKEWEKNFEPIDIDNTVSIRAPFHENGNLKYHILIEPKMSSWDGASRNHAFNGQTPTTNRFKR